MEDNELLLIDRIEKIKSINKQYNLEDNAYISFSGGKDSTIVHYLIDLALPNNNIPRVFVNTGIEYQKIVDFVKAIAKNDKRIKIINSGINIKNMLEKEGYPFKSKLHSANVMVYQNNKEEINNFISNNPTKTTINKEKIENLKSGCKTVIKYYYGLREKNGKLYDYNDLPKSLKYQFESDLSFKISDKCCNYLKKEPLKKWQAENQKNICITGMRKTEGGRRSLSLNCIKLDKSENLISFHPIAVVNNNFEQWFAEKYNIKLCDLYKEPYNFERTGCKGCPFNIKLKEDLDTMKYFFPNEYKQIEKLWEPVYKEYRKLNYRLTKQVNIYDFAIKPFSSNEGGKNADRKD